MAAIACAVRASGEGTLEYVRREVTLGSAFGVAAFERAFHAFRKLYHVRPTQVRCSPDVLSRYCALFERTEHVAHEQRIVYDGIPLLAAILPPGTIAFEGEVDPERMGDW